MSTEIKKRIEWIDTAKGVGIFLIVFGHLLVNGNGGIITQAVYSFHVPMFFMLSGWLLNPVSYSRAGFISKKARRLLLPSAVFLLITYPIYLFQCFQLKTPLLEIAGKTFYIKGQLAFNDPV